MKVKDIIEEMDDGDDERQYPNPIHYDYEKATEIYDLADDVVSELVSLYNKEHGITEFVPALYRKAAALQKEKYGKVIDVPVDNLISMESHVYEPHMKKLSKSVPDQSIGKLPHIFKVENVLLVADGNHRIVAEIEKGNKTVKAVVLDIGALAKQFKI